MQGLTALDNKVNVSKTFPVHCVAMHPLKQVFAVAHRYSLPFLTGYSRMQLYLVFIMLTYELNSQDAVFVYDLNSESWLSWSPKGLGNTSMIDIITLSWKPNSGNTLAVICRYIHTHFWDMYQAVIVSFCPY
jgi:hypothetical protein